jgi:hypothetical protein
MRRVGHINRPRDVRSPEGISFDPGRWGIPGGYGTNRLHSAAKPPVPAVKRIREKTDSVVS